MKNFFVVALLVSLVNVSICQDVNDDNELTAVSAADAPCKCSCILPLVLLPGGGQVTNGVLNNLLQGGLLNVNDANTLKYLLGGGEVTSGLLNNLLQGGLLNADIGNVLKYLLGGGQVTGGLLNNLLQGGVLNANEVNGLMGGQATGGIGNNLLQGGIGNGLIQLLLSKGLLGGLLSGLLGGSASPPSGAISAVTTPNPAFGSVGNCIQASATSGPGPISGSSTQYNSGILSGLLSNNGLNLDLLNGQGYGYGGSGGSFTNTQDNSGLLSGVASGNVASVSALNGVLGGRRGLLGDLLGGLLGGNVLGGAL